jgi:hypothetical protein
LRPIGPVCCLLLLAGCARDAAVPPFAARPYAPFSRQETIAIALREWRLFGQIVADAPPTSPLGSPLGGTKPERAPGLWQRVGEYWWIGQNPGVAARRWTGRNDASGQEFPATADARYAWSAAFISYVMRIAGAGDGFPYAPDHAAYIEQALAMAQGRVAGYVITALSPSAAAPQPGDLICTGRGSAAHVRLATMPAGYFPSHCDLVVMVSDGQLAVIGGDVEDAVAMKHVPVAADGRLRAADGTTLDARYDWFAVLRVRYAAP